MLPLIPVIDIRHGIAVHAIAGDRSNYRPLRSSIVSGVEPARILLQLAEQLPSLKTCYVADLDAIEGRDVNRCVMAEMVRVGVSLLVDAGSDAPDHVESLLDLGVETVVISSESCSDLEHLALLVRQFGSSQICASIDLKAGMLVTKDPRWRNRSSLDFAGHVVESGFTQAIVLDLIAVGTSCGIPTLSVCKTISNRFQDLDVITGGGVRSWDCFVDAERAGVRGVLVGSALHDGRLAVSHMS